MASLFLGQKVRPLVLLDGDDAGRVRKDALMRELYSGHERSVLLLSDVLKMPECEVEDILGETVVLPAVSKALGKKIVLTEEDKKAGSLPAQIKAAAARQKIELPDGWKGVTAIELISQWAKEDAALDNKILDTASALFDEISARFK
jgi:hypothetical protein